MPETGAANLENIVFRENKNRFHSHDFKNSYLYFRFPEHNMRSVSVKLPVELYEKYFAKMDAREVQEIMENALAAYLGKEAAGV